MKNYQLLKILLVLLLLPLKSAAQEDSTLLRGTFVNNEFNVYITIDLYHQNITVPGQEVFGPMAGYFGDRKDWRKWLFATAKITGKGRARLGITNDYGSEDLQATLVVKPDGSATLTQGDGSDMKIARNRKWVKLPKEIVFQRMK